MANREEPKATIEKSSFTVDGMTCEACVSNISKQISSLPFVNSVIVNLQKKSVEVYANRKIAVNEMALVLSGLPKYKVSDPAKSQDAIAESILKTYKPLIVLFTFIFCTSLAYQISIGSFHWHLLMNHIMAGFFLGLSFFKFLNLKAFAESFSGYDPIAQRWVNYGFVYPFIELLLGLVFVAQVGLQFANAITIIVLTLTTIGVYRRLQSKSKIQCACLGTTFNLPLSNVTIFENVVMVIMATYAFVTY